MSVRRSTQTRLQKLKASKKKRTNKADPYEKYKRTGGRGLGLSSAVAVNKKREEEKKRKARIRADLEKRQAKKAKKERVTREEGPGQGTKPKRKSSYTSPFAGMPKDSVSVRTAGQSATSPEDRKKRKDAAKKREDKRTWKDAAEAGIFLAGGPLLSGAIKVVSGGFKLGKKVYTTLKAAQNAAKVKQGVKKFTQKQLAGPPKLRQISTSRKTPKQITATKRITDQRPPSVRGKPQPSKKQFETVVSGKGTTSKVPNLKQPTTIVKGGPKTKQPTTIVKGGPKTKQPTTIVKGGPKTKQPTIVKGGPKTKQPTIVKGGPKTKQPTTIVKGGPKTKQPTTIVKGGPKTKQPTIVKGGPKPQSRKYQPPRAGSPFKPTTAKTTTKGLPKGTGSPKKNPFGGKYGGTWPKQGKWTPAVGRAKAVRALKNAGKAVTLKNIAKVGGGALAGYGLSKLLDATPGQKPTTETGTRTRASLNQPYHKKKKKPVRKFTDPYKTQKDKRPATAVPPKPIDGMAASSPKKETGKQTGSAKLGGRPEERRSRHVAEDKRHFAISKGGTQDDPNRGFRRRLFGKNVSEAEAKKSVDEAYKQEQADRKRGGQSDHYQYGTGRRSQLKGKQGVKKGGTIRAKKGRAIVKKSYNTGGTVRFSSGGSVIDTYNYDN